MDNASLHLIYDAGTDTLVPLFLVGILVFSVFFFCAAKYGWLKVPIKHDHLLVAFTIIWALCLYLSFDAGTDTLEPLFLMGMLTFSVFLFFAVKNGSWKVPIKRKYLLVAFTFVLASIAAVETGKVFYRGLQCRTWAKSGQYRVVEGPITSFHPMPKSGHDWERITVGGVTFAYSDFQSKGGFNHTASHGGPMREGLYVRIAYRKGRILKLWIAD